MSADSNDGGGSRLKTKPYILTFEVKIKALLNLQAPAQITPGVNYII